MGDPIPLVSASPGVDPRAVIIFNGVTDKSWSTVCQHLPPYILVVQKVPMTVRYAHGPGSMERFKGTSAGHMKALLKLKTPPSVAHAADAPTVTITEPESDAPTVTATGAVPTASVTA